MRKLLFLLPFLASCNPNWTLADAPPPGLSPMPAVPPLGSSPPVRTATTISGQPLKLPQGPAEMISARVVIPAGGATPIHQHPWSRFVYVEQGPLRVVNHDTGQSRDFPSGTVLPEVVAQWHEGRAIAGPVTIIVIDLVPPGASNMIMR